MALQKKQMNGYTYFELYFSCPVCQSQGRNTPHSFWSHHECGGRMYVGDNAHYWCDNCGDNSHVKKWKYGCPHHGGGYEFLSVDAGTIASVIAMAGMLTGEAGVGWLQAFLSHLGEF